METTPKSLRLQLAICGRINAGKSTLFNLISDQDAAITSPQRGTTTDVVEKVMELRPLGPAVLLDTAGMDDLSALGSERMKKTLRAVDRADAVLLVASPDGWGETEKNIFALAKERKTAVIPVINFHTSPAGEEQLKLIRKDTGCEVLQVCAADRNSRDSFLSALTAAIQQALPERTAELPFLNDLIPADSLVVMMTPIDTQAPKGRLIMPEVMAIRDALDGSAAVVIARENAFPEIFAKLSETPSLVVCDSQVVKQMISVTPPEIPQTTFSILMSRMKGDICTFAEGAAAIASLKAGDKVLIAEACTHHAADNDIGRTQIPQLLQKKCGGKLAITFAAGADYPADLSTFDLVIHCGGCMLNRQAMMNRLRTARQAGVPICNYGMSIAACQGVIEKVLSPFPEALQRYLDELDKQ